MPEPKKQDSRGFACSLLSRGLSCRSWRVLPRLAASFVETVQFAMDLRERQLSAFPARSPKTAYMWRYIERRAASCWIPIRVPAHQRTRLSRIASPWADRGGLGLKISRLTLIDGGSNSVRSLAQKIKSDRASRTLCKIHCTSLMTLTGIVFGHGPERLLVCRTMRLGKRDEWPKSAE